VTALAGRRQPLPGARWTRDGAVVAAAGRATVHDDGALEIEDVQASDAGEYRCGVEMGDDLDAEDEARWSDAFTLTVLHNPSDGKNSYDSGGLAIRLTRLHTTAPRKRKCQGAGFF